MKALSHSAAFKAQGDFALESKITKVGANIWSDGVAGDRLFKLLLSKGPSTIGKVIDQAAKLESPFTAKQVQGHLRWAYTAGAMEIDGASFPVPAKVAKPVKPEPKPEVAKVEPEPKVEKPKAKPKAKAMAARKSVHVKTKKAA